VVGAAPFALSIVLLLVSGSQPPAKELAREQYEMFTAPSALPADVQAAFGRHLGQAHLHVAAADEPFARTDLVLDRSLPRRRLVAAAVGKKYAVLHYEQGGIGFMRRVVVFERTPAGVTEVWSGTVRKTFEPPPELERALRDRTLWDKAVRR
jgi:hypothetical protein